MSQVPVRTRDSLSSHIIGPEPPSPVVAGAGHKARDQVVAVQLTIL